MTDERKILYVGDDDIFFKDLKVFYDKKCSRDKVACEQIIITDNSNLICQLSTTFVKTRPHLCILDFSKISQDSKLISDIISYLLIIKKHHLFRSIPLFGLFTSLEEFNNIKFITASGIIVYSHIKGENDDTFFHDSFYIAYEENAKFPKYAIADHLALNHYFHAPSTITGLNGDALQIESDIEAKIDEDIEAKTNLFPEFKIKKFDVSFKEESSIYYDYLYNAEFRIPFAGPWDEITEDTMQKDTFETWIDFNREQLRSVYSSVLIVTNSLPFLTDFSKYQNPKISFYFTSHLHSGLEIIKILKPNLVIFSFDNLHDEDEKFNIPQRLPNSLNTLTQIVTLIRTFPGYIPVIVTFNNPSSSEAIQKVYGYNSIISSPAEISMNLVKQLLDNFEKNYIAKIEPDQTYKFHLVDNRRIIEIKRNTTITSLTEHEITFLCDFEIPFYTTIKFDQPFDLYVTVVPSIRQIDNQGSLKHYMGFIHTVSEVQLQTLRQFVNYLLFKRPKEFLFDIKLIDEELQKQIKAAPRVINDEPQKVDKVSEIKREASASHKSKL